MAQKNQQIADGLKTLIHESSSVSLEDIPEPVLRKAALVIGDNMAAMVASRDEPEVYCFQEQIMKKRMGEEATVFRGGRQQTDRYSAAVANAAAANWCELDEGYRKASCHAGLYTLPALLAESEAVQVPVREVLRCEVLSYEMISRFARSWKFPSTLHPHALFSSLGAAAAMALVRHLGTKEFMDALTSSATLTAVGPYTHAIKGALIENMWAASGAWNGMQSVEWAQCGIGGMGGTIHEVYGVILGGKAGPDHLTSEFGCEWAITNGFHKIYSCCHSLHSAVEAAFGLLPHMSSVKDREKIKRILIETHPSGLLRNNVQPETTLAARFSIQHAVAAPLALGHAEAEAFSSPTLNDPKVAGLRNKIELKPFLPMYPWPNDRPSRVTIEFEDGFTLSRECLSARGGPDRPFSEREILDKVSSLTSHVYPNFTRTIEDLLTLRPARQGERWDQFVERLVST